MRFYGVVRAAWGAGYAHMLFQTVSYTVVCVVLRDRHVENDHSTPYEYPDIRWRPTSHRRILLPLKPLTKHEATKSGFRTRPPQKQLENERW